MSNSKGSTIWDFITDNKELSIIIFITSLILVVYVINNYDVELSDVKITSKQKVREDKIEEVDADRVEENKLKLNRSDEILISDYDKKPDSNLEINKNNTPKKFTVRLLEERDGTPLANKNIYIREYDYSTKTDASGSFDIPDFIRKSKESYEMIAVEIEDEKGNSKTVNIGLSESTEYKI